MDKGNLNTFRKNSLFGVVSTTLSLLLSSTTIANTENQSMLDLANKGYAQAQHYMGESYLKGHSTNKSINLARYWFERAADQGLPQSAFYTHSAEQARRPALLLHKTLSLVGPRYVPRIGDVALG